MIKLEFKGLTELRATMSELSDRRFNAAIATAMTRSTVTTRAVLQRELAQSIDRPTPYTTRQLKYVAARADRLSSAVGFDVQAITDIAGTVLRYEDAPTGTTPAGKYMFANVNGGPRRHKRFEQALIAARAMPRDWYTVPAKSSLLDAYGNVSRGLANQILSQLRIQLLSGSNQIVSFDSRKQIRAQRRAGGQYFVMPVGGKTQPGIYQREFFGKSITPVFIFVKQTQYKKRFKFYEIAEKTFDAEMANQVPVALEEQLARVRSSAA